MQYVLYYYLRKSIFKYQDVLTEQFEKIFLYGDKKFNKTNCHGKRKALGRFYNLVLYTDGRRHSHGVKVYRATNQE